MKQSLALLVPVAALFVSCASPGTTSFVDGVRFFREGYFASARDAFDVAVQLDPKSPAAWNNRAASRARLGDLDGAVQDYTRALQLAPSDAEVVFNRGNAYAAAGNLSAAINDFTAAISLRTDYARAYFNRGTARSVTGDYAGAISDWQWAVNTELDPWTRAAMRRGSGLDAASALPSAVATAPAPLDVRALVARAMSREVEGDRAGAVADLRAAAVAEPDLDRRARIDRLLRGLDTQR